eukprot:CAMPEP_0178913308 /NCGR_PEP_ID=MMETSP0786-20121207/10767_1 /TAXON_ID=186022 /ORGANISM="Thalassionema frauenfeldii, Strain CCMP 1798" /LENGTH=442 /DNA_ID=CAMNT_0020586029 /DNA_START=101 /DNA_END=1426 /DNA_ORIENTATION=+
MTSLSSRRLAHALQRSCSNSRKNNVPVVEPELFPVRNSYLKKNGQIRFASTSGRENTSNPNYEAYWSALAVGMFLSGAFLYTTPNNSSSCQSSFGDGFFSSGNASGLILTSPSRLEEDEEESNSKRKVTNKRRTGRGGEGKNSKLRKQTGNRERNSTYDVSVRAIQGCRLYMEDEYVVGNGGRFVGVFDGHGGGDVSYFLAQNLHKHVKQQMYRQLKRKQWEEPDENKENKKLSISSLVSALRAAFEAVENEVIGKEEMQYQGSTAVTVTIHEEKDGSRTLLSANVGDSRAVLCRGGTALDLTKDHKPNDEKERERIQGMGEKIEWDNFGKVHRVKNLSLSRAIGDSFAKPVVSPEVDINLFRVHDDDEFIVVASDGVWDVMSSNEVVKFVKRKIDTLIPTSSGSDAGKRIRNTRRKNMSRYVANEALNRGSGDNICVVIVW